MSPQVAADRAAVLDVGPPSSQPAASVDHPKVRARTSCIRRLLRTYPFEIAVILFATLYTALALSPSSYGWALRILGVTNTGTYIGTPRIERWDEWAVQTPYIQALVRSGLGAHYNVSSFYDEPFRNIISLPVMDWGFVFKPLFWGFRFLPPAWALSFYYAAAAASTLVGWTVLLRRIGVKYLLAIAASLALFFAPYTQAWWSALLPLYALFPWMLVLFTSRARVRYLAIPCAWLAASCVVSTAYLPGLVLLSFVGATFLASFVVRRQTIGRLMLLGLFALVGAGVGLLYLAPVLKVLANTVYPGHRVTAGGDLFMGQWFSQFAPMGVTKGYVSQISNNLPESVAIGSWLPILAMVLVDYRRVLRGEARAALRPVVVFGAAFLLLSAWQGVADLHWLGAAFLWNRAPEQRSLLASGLILMMASVWVISQFPLKLNFRRALLFLGMMLLTTGASAVIVTRRGSADRILASAHDNLWALAISGLLAVGVVLTVKRWRDPAGVTALVAVLPCVAAWALYNPVQDTRPIFRPIATDVTRALDRDAAKRPDGAIAARFPAAMLNGLGYNSVLHALALPELDVFSRLFPELDPQRLNMIFNRYLELSLYSGTEPRLIGTVGATAELPQSVIERHATISSVSAYPLPAKW